MLVEKHNVSFADMPFHIELYSATNEQPHYHENALEILLCLSGNIEITSSTEHGVFEAGDIMSFDPADIHFTKGECNNLLLSFYFDINSSAYETIGLYNMTFNCNKHMPGRHERILNTLDVLKSELLTLTTAYFYPQTTPEQSGKTMLKLAQRIVRNMADNFLYLALDNDINDYSDDFKKRFAEITSYIQTHYREKITLQQLSSLAHIDATYLSHIFKTIDSDGFKSYLYKIRIYHSEHLLLEHPELNIPDISYMCGFSDVKIYHREFKKNFYGITPHKYLLQYRNYSKIVEPNTYHDITSIPEDFKLLLLKSFLSIHC